MLLQVGLMTPSIASIFLKTVGGSSLVDCGAERRVLRGDEVLAQDLPNVSVYRSIPWSCVAQVRTTLCTGGHRHLATAGRHRDRDSDDRGDIQGG